MTLTVERPRSNAVVANRLRNWNKLSITFNECKQKNNTAKSKSVSLKPEAASGAAELLSGDCVGGGTKMNTHITSWLLNPDVLTIDVWYHTTQSIKTVLQSKLVVTILL